MGELELEDSSINKTEPQQPPQPQPLDPVPEERSDVQEDESDIVNQEADQLVTSTLDDQSKSLMSGSCAHTRVCVCVYILLYLIH